MRLKGLESLSILKDMFKQEKKAVSTKEPQTERSQQTNARNREDVVSESEDKSIKYKDEIARRLVERNKEWQRKRDLQTNGGITGYIVTEEMRQQRQAEAKEKREELRERTTETEKMAQEKSNKQKQEAEAASVDKQLEIQQRINRNNAALKSIENRESSYGDLIARTENSISLFNSNLQKINKAIDDENARINSVSDNGGVEGRVARVAIDINNHRTKEQQKYIRMPAIGMAEHTMGGKTWVVNAFVLGYDFLKGDGDVVSKNQAKGDEIRHFVVGGRGKCYKHGASWVNYSTGIKEITMRFANDGQRYDFTSLRLLMQDLKVESNNLQGLMVQRIKIEKEINESKAKVEAAKSNLQSLADEKRQLLMRIEEDQQKLKALEQSNNQKEQERLELLRKQQEEERLRLEEEEKKRKEEEERLRKEEEEKAAEIERINNEAEALLRSIEEKKEKIRIARTFIREENALRSQHFLDDSQEAAKRSHFFDGKTVVIEGGPGTGKTTTLIQRIKFLIAPEAFEDYATPLTQKQKEELLDPNTLDTKWIFISPNAQLRHYLLNNMTNEGLRANANNTKSIDKYRLDLFNSYGLKNPNSDGPFKYYEDDEYDTYEQMILEHQTVEKSFEKFVLDAVNASFQKAVNMNTDEYGWKELAENIKNRINTKNCDSLDVAANLLCWIEEKESVNVRNFENDVNKRLVALAYKTKELVSRMPDVDALCHNMYSQWERDNRIVDDEEEDTEVVNEEEEVVVTDLSYDQYVFGQLRSVLRTFASKITDSKTSVPKKQQDLYAALKDVLSDDDKATLNKLAKDMLFIKTYAMLCKGVGVNIFNKLPQMYKAYRKSVVSDEQQQMYNHDLLVDYIGMESNKVLHQDEVDFLIGFINGLLLKIRKISVNRFESLKHRYVTAYKENVRPVIAVDEATDYTLLDYYLIASLRYYEYSALSLCGDSMQGLNDYGLTNWNKLKDILGEEPVVVELCTSYRQLPRLVEMSKAMYLDEMGRKAPYSSKKQLSDNDPEPLMYISNNRNDKLEWIARRLNDIQRQYDNHMPSVALFIGDDVDANRFVKELKGHRRFLNGIRIEDCTNQRQAEGSDVVRVYRLQEVKGMEFEVAIFYDLDRALENTSSNLMRRYLYVGISRATTHLAATFSSAEGNADVIKYFDSKAVDWQ